MFDYKSWNWLYVLIGLLFFYAGFQDFFINQAYAYVSLIVGVLLMFGGLYSISNDKPFLKK